MENLNLKSKLNDNLVAQFLLKSLPNETLSALRVMTIVKYPIEDKQAFVIQLDNILNDTNELKEIKDAVQGMRNSFSPIDFPILTLQSGLEKLHTKLSNELLSNPNLFVPAFPRPEVPPRNVWLEYIERFGPNCGQRAFEAYVQAPRPRNDIGDEIAAYKAGLAAGNNCP